MSASLASRVAGMADRRGLDHPCRAPAVVCRSPARSELVGCFLVFFPPKRLVPCQLLHEEVKFVTKLGMFSDHAGDVVSILGREGCFADAGGKSRKYVCSQQIAESSDQASAKQG
jgi:hypothetical protein